MSIKAAFVCRPGTQLIEVDYSQMEVACLAAASGDPTLISEVTGGVDMHTNNAARWKRVPEDQVAKKDRKTAKIMTFQLTYGARAKRIAEDFGLPQTETQAFIDAFIDKYTGVAKWWDETIEWVDNNLAPVPVFLQPEPEYRTTLIYPYGKRYTFVGQMRNSKWGGIKPNVGPQFVKNYPIQGLAADILKMAQASLWQHSAELLNFGTTPAIQIHDALYFRAPKDLDLSSFLGFLKHHMLERPIERINQLAGYEWWPTVLPLRLDMKTGTRWSDMVNYK